ncbi:peptidoglycan DD-metalloendopeptidase family protein [Luteimonas sp. BDR2-5]|uniref:peptidoglycan DD-metalloendopeptidase family protein n=1 Tax=Proluteimonas luteida TaxID=2878685 RepID=UPI001E614966|nr:peptidoglycan DD-metalloendopeptidase family protein [Luteimonas sp. BDR2-5]MCD9027579.1 peptidoglycan DD-metalloendopeptidase family protein [Luteimonas sp. BDR2-5]
MRILLVVLSVLLLAACGTSRVVREGGSTATTSTPRPGQTVTVQRGDTVYRLATSNGISPLDLAMWNNIRAPYTIYPGQRLRLYPSGSATGGTTAAAATPSRPATSGSTAVRPTQATPQPPAPVPASSPFRWQWPTDGQVIGRFTAGEPTKQGVDIAGTGGQPVRAAAAGVVVYSGSGLVGYGELIIVKHDDNWLSAYGHNRTRRVNEGERVSAGQQIAEMGRTGAARDMLHFEIRYNGKPVDPLSYLPAR